MKNSNWQGWVQVKWKPGTPESAWKNWTKNPWVKGVWSTQGNWDCTVWIDVKTQDQFEEKNMLIPLFNSRIKSRIYLLSEIG